MERNVSNKVREDRDFSLIDFDLIVREKRRMERGNSGVGLNRGWIANLEGNGFQADPRVLERCWTVVL